MGCFIGRNFDASIYLYVETANIAAVEALIQFAAKMNYSNGFAKFLTTAQCFAYMGFGANLIASELISFRPKYPNTFLKRI